MERITHILERIDSRLLSELWTFYRDTFHSDEECISFIYNVIKDEPHNTSSTYHQVDDTDIFVDENGNQISDKIFYPRRMMNAVNRMVSAARDMEQIRRGKDVFKIVYLVTCVETLQKLCGKENRKKELLFDFFETYTSENDKEFVRQNFKHSDEESPDYNEDSFRNFIGVLNEYRNCAAHEGNYWDYCFNNNSDKECPVLLICKVNLINFTPKSKKEHCFETKMSYLDFEHIFIRTCIKFINCYLSSEQHKKVCSVSKNNIIT